MDNFSKEEEDKNGDDDFDDKNKTFKFSRNHFAEEDDLPDKNMEVENFERESNSKAIIGRWTRREHELFIDCLKKFGKDWDKIEDTIPTRTGTQIRSHAQKFFARIRREFNTKDPMDFITKNMCDNSRIYNFDSFRDQQNLGDKQTSEYKEMNVDDKNKRNKLSNIEELSLDSMKYDKQDDEIKIQSTKQESKHKISKMSKHNLTKFNHLQEKKQIRNEMIKNERKQSKMFRITKMNNKKESSQGSFYNVSSEEQKNVIMNYPFLNKKSFKYSKEGSDGDSNLSTKGSLNYICLDGGKVIIKGNEIETIVPCDIEIINNKVTMISPRYPVKVSIYPVSLSQPHVYNPKSQSFTSKESYQFSGQGSNAERQSQNSQTPSNTSLFNPVMNLNAYQPNPQLDSLIQILGQNYCIGNCDVLVRMQNSNTTSNFQNQDLRMQRSSSQAPVNITHILNNSISGSSNRYSCESQLYRQNIGNSER